MKKNLSVILLLSTIMSVNIAYAQNLNQKYSITIWNKDFKGIERENHIETLGFLPTFKNNRDEITIGNRKIILENTLDIQIIEDKSDIMKVSLKYKDNEKQYTKEVLLKDKEKKDLEDFKIEIDKK